MNRSQHVATVSVEATLRHARDPITKVIDQAGAFTINCLGGILIAGTRMARRQAEPCELSLPRLADARDGHGPLTA